RDVRVVLPNDLREKFHTREASYTLETDVELSAGQRGHAATLVLDCFHAPLALTVDGTDVKDTGEVGVGEHLFLIDGSLTTPAQIHLALSARFNVESQFGFGIAPRIVPGSVHGDWVAPLNRYTQEMVFVLDAFFAFTYGILFLLDRRRHEYLAG